jgi:hypothetical protein
MIELTAQLEQVEDVLFVHVDMFAGRVRGCQRAFVLNSLRNTPESAFRPPWTCFPRAPAHRPLHSGAMGADD